ncbi:MAG: ACT domain-containing protein [Clostridiales bacterium]|nr:ACT domain-containing protein [Clostridiales bacterium]
MKFIKQLSVFIENRTGRLNEITRVLAESDINIVCVSLADTSEYGVFRLIVSNPKKAQEILNEKGFSSTLTDVIGVNLPHHFGMLNKMTEALTGAEISLSYVYALNSGKDNAQIIIKTSDNSKAEKVLKETGFELMDSVTAYNL